MEYDPGDFYCFLSSQFLWNSPCVVRLIEVSDFSFQSKVKTCSKLLQFVLAKERIFNKD